MRFSGIVSLALTAMLAVSCRAPKEIAYFQDMTPGESEVVMAAAQDIKVQPKDRLSIVVNTQEPKLNSLFNIAVASRTVGQEANEGSSSQGVSAYTVGSDGCISFPILGKVKVAGMSREEIASYIAGQLVGKELVKDPVVTVEYVDLYVNVLGEVSSPGRYNIKKDNMTVIEALSMAGDLTINGKRDNIKVLRNEGGKQHVYALNLCSGNDVYSSPVYYLKQGDVVYVEPNDTKKRQATVNGNTVRSTSFWFSLASLLTSVVILIVK